MNIILKYTLQNIKENPFRTFLILLSVTLSAALFLGSIALAGTIEKTYGGLLKKYYGNAEVMVYTNHNSPSYLSTSMLTPLQNQLEYSIGVTQRGGIYKVSKEEVALLNLNGYDLEEFSQIHPFHLAAEKDLIPFRGKKIILSKQTCQTYKLKPGDTLTVEVNGTPLSFALAGIAEPIGFFQEDGQSTLAVVPKEYLNNLDGVRNKATVLYLKLKDPAQKAAFIAHASQLFPRYTVEETIKDADLVEYTSRITQPFMMMLTTVIMMSVFIIYTSFKVIAMERIPIIGTFRSIGATRKMVNQVFLMESLTYGTLGGLLGCFLGIGILFAMAKLSAPNWIPGMKTEVVFSFSQLLATFLLAVILALASSALPIWKAAKISIKDIILGNTQQQKKSKKTKYYTGAVFILLPFIIPPFSPQQLLIPIGILCTILAVSGLIMVMPLFIRLMLSPLQHIYSLLFGNEGVLALQNLRENKNIATNISLLALGIASLLMVKIVGTTVMTEITSFFQDWNFQVLAISYEADRDFIGSLRSTAGIKDAYGTLIAKNIQVAGTAEKIGTIEGVNQETFEFMLLETPIGPEKTIELLNQGRNIMLSNFLKNKLQLEEGDIIRLKFEKGVLPYKIIGFLNTIENSGQYAIVADRYLKMDAGQRYYDMIYIQTEGTPEDAQKALNNKFKRNPFWNDTVFNIEQRNNQMNAQLFTMMDGFSYLTMLIGIFGVFNNFVLSFYERRRVLAVMRSLGLAKKQLLKMLFIESLSVGILGGLSGVAGGLLICSIIPYVLRSMGLKGNLLYSGTLLFLAIAVGIIISILASLSPNIRSAKASIIASLKYE